MAKEKAKAKESKAKAKAADDEDEAPKSEFKYGVGDIAEALDIKPASVRVQLRNKGIEKAGKSYGWNSKAELKEVIDQLKGNGDDEDEKPAKKAKASKDEKPAKGKAKDKAAKGKKKPADDEDDD